MSEMLKRLNSPKVIRGIDLTLALALLATCCVLAWRNFVQIPLSFDFFLDEIFSMFDRDMSYLELRRHLIDYHETHPVNYDFLIGKFSLFFNGSLAALRATSMIAMFGSMALLTWQMLEKTLNDKDAPKLLTPAALCLLIFLNNDLFQFWGVITRSYAAQIFFFTLLLFASQRGNKILYAISLLAVGSLHFFGTILVLALIALEDPKKISLKTRIFVAIAMLPSLHPLILLLLQENMQPLRVPHYPQMDFVLLFKILFNAFQKIQVPVFASLGAGLLLDRKHISKGIKALWRENRTLFITIGLFLVIGLTSIITGKKWIDRHTFIFVQVSSVLLLFLVLTTLRAKTQLAVCAAIAIFSVPKTKWSMIVRYFPEHNFSSSVRYIGDHPETFSDKKLYLCLYNTGVKSVEFLSSFYGLAIKPENLIEICDKEKLLEQMAQNPGSIVIQHRMPGELFEYVKPLLHKKIAPEIWESTTP